MKGIESQKTLAVILYDRYLAKLFNVCPAIIMNWIKSYGNRIDVSAPSRTIKEIDEMWHFIGSKKKLRVIKAIDRVSGKTIVWVTSGINTQIVKQFYEKIKHCKQATFYTDNWDAFTKVLPKDRHVIGKKHILGSIINGDH